MHKKLRVTIASTFLAVSAFFYSSSDAYVLKGSHILHLMTQKNGNPESIAVSQVMTLYGDEFQDNEISIEEKLKYKFPKHFRSDTKNDQTLKIQVISGSQVLTIIDEKISSTSETGIDHYKDIIFYRNRILLENRLKTLGVDLSVSSLGRFNGKIVYIIGAKYPDNSKPQLWIDKETFRPIRLLIKNPTDLKTFLEFRYIIWQKNGKIWYPMQTNIFRQDYLIRAIKVNRVDVNPQFAEELFDIAHLQSVYPQVAPDIYEPKETDELKDVQQSIEDLKKIFE